MSKPAKSMLVLGILASGRGSNFEAIQTAIDRGDLQAVIKLVVSDKEKAPVLKKAASWDIKTAFIDPHDYISRGMYEEALLKEFKAAGVELVVLAGYMRLVSKKFLDTYPQRVLNIHPALLPSFVGLHAQRQALEAGVSESGCTVHIVDEGMDTGPIVLQRTVPVYPGDNEETLTQRILQQEHDIYWRAIQLFAEGRLHIDGSHVEILGRDNNEARLDQRLR